VGNFIRSSRCEFYDDDFTVTSFKNIKCGNVANEILLEQCAVIVFLWAKYMQIRFILRCIQHMTTSA